MDRNTLLILIVVILLLGGFSAPVYPYNRDWGYYPVGGLGFVFVVLLIFLLLGLR